ncbi:TrkH family potassium uptake protein [Marivivens marinus]|uniref:TrkH family potassium uptake protein n=1 Tax=Marivivens marinus TaxID=3110173 RepID=UPI003B845B7C
MLSRITALPFFVLLMGAGAVAMLMPAVHGAATGQFVSGRVFFYGFVLFGILTVLIALATVNYAPRSAARSHLTTLLAAFTVLPIMLAVPFWVSVGRISFLDAWFEMVSSFTTTGATVFDAPWRLGTALHLWRAQVGWMGGFLVWVAALAILAPLNLGGFEVRAQPRRGGGAMVQIGRIADPSERLARFSARLAPIYLGLTVVLWLGLMLTGERAVVALIHAMAVLSTSGISATGGLFWAGSGFWGEFLILIFYVFALSRLTFSRGLAGEDRGGLWRDPEFRMGLALLVLVPAFLFLRHFFGAIDEQSLSGFRAAFEALWGGLFTVASFLTTTGFESRYWMGAADWSGLSTPGLVLIGLALTGGGIATTAGGVKLLRVYALFRHSQRELERLVHPHSVGGAGQEARSIRRQGAYVAWIFFMLFALSIVGVMVALSLTGVQFENSMVLAVAALSTTGPLAEIAAEDPISIAGIPDLAKTILAFAMVLGRLEALAIIALLNPHFWRN